MFSLLDQIIDSHSSPKIISENHNTDSINWARGLSDPGEMLGCGMYQELRRRANESDEVYQYRLMNTPMPDGLLDKIKAAAVNRASLDVSTGKVDLVVAGKLPWHGLGINVESALDSKQVQQLALNWKVGKYPVSYQFNGQTIESKETFALVREDTGKQLGSVGPIYKPIQNSEGFEFLDDVLKQFGAKYESAGSLYGGKKVFMLAHLPEQRFTINGGDNVEPYVIFTNSHDGTSAAKCYPTTVRVVCANTFRVSAREEKKGISIRHTGNLKAKIESAQSALGLAVEGFQHFKEQSETLYSKPLDVRHYANDVLDAVLDVTQADSLKGADALAAVLQVSEAERALAAKSFERKIKRRGEVLDDILNRYESQTNGINGIRGTAWAAWNAVTEHADHSKIGRKVGSQEDQLSRRFESVIDGSADELKQTAFQLALKA